MENGEKMVEKRRHQFEKSTPKIGKFTNSPTLVGEGNFEVFIMRNTYSTWLVKQEIIDASRHHRRSLGLASASNLDLDLNLDLSNDQSMRSIFLVKLYLNSKKYQDSAHPNILWELTSSSSHALQIPREDAALLIDTRHLSSSFKTFTNVFIAVVVAGVLGLPYSFKKIGWLMVVVLAVTLVALMVPNFADFLSLVGSSVCIVLGFVLPAMFHLIAFKKELVSHGLAFDVALVLMGAVFAVYGTYSSMLEIFEVSLKLATFFILQLNCIMRDISCTSGVG
ncbi:Amino acid transporter ANTL2 [Capsicum baccatum]|uniref:Amino acid transporter ANTL2 n=1 Tax=Capsicum baccatum TaxID=33114 RepID=A0A2G2V264_CAPBA|nr:Amino acid transporter ANTL2 [Capsicum baccatum]